MAMKVVKLRFENTDGGKYSFYTTAEKLLPILGNELFTELIIDAKSGEEVIHKDRIIKELGLEPPKNNQ